MKEVVISIRSVQDYDDEKSQSFEFTTDGLYSFENGVGRLTYYESEVSGLPGTRTTMSISPEEIVLNREGFLTSCMVFREGKKNAVMYDTPYGTAKMGIDTRRIRQSFDEKGGNMELNYILDIEHAVVGKNKLELNVKEIGPF